MWIVFVIVGLMIYGLSFHWWYEWVKRAHSVRGRFSDQDATVIEFLIMISPLLNTVMCLTGWVFYPPNSCENWNKFFSVDKGF